MSSPLDRDLMDADALLARIVASPDLWTSQRKALRGALGAVQGVRTVRRTRHLRVVSAGRPAAPVADFRQRQLPVGDRDEGGAPDAA